ncbi:hypothetical protein [Gordonia sp. MP11Mi]|uniref:Uncharacterized protein n=1 Tax=Gordonia sp. MP11Mi TaxID=3022769 RepID=A0AA97GUA7_9ACTN
MFRVKERVLGVVAFAALAAPLAAYGSGDSTSGSKPRARVKVEDKDAREIGLARVNLWTRRRAETGCVPRSVVEPN